MKVLLYADWPLALTYLNPVARYLQKVEPDWEVGFSGVGVEGLPAISLDDLDVSIYCDELSVAPRGKLNLCIFHGLASKAQAFSSTRRDTFTAGGQVFCVPGPYYRDLLLSLGASNDSILVTGLTKFDGLQRKVLYAPTHNIELSAIPVIQDRIYEIPNVSVHLHMYSRNGTKPHQEQHRSFYPEHLQDEDILEVLDSSNVVIGDFGSIIVEAIALGKQAIQVVNPDYEVWYLKRRGISREEMNLLPEVHLPRKYAIQVHTFDELKEALDTVSNIGSASEAIYNFIKASFQS